MPHIHTEPGQHDLTASAFIFRTDGRTPRLLLHLHKRLNRWMHMGGHVELHETPWAAVVHEILEESGYNLGQLRLLQPQHTVTDFGDEAIAHPVPFVFGTYPYGSGENHYHTDTSFVFVTTEEPRHPTAEDESKTLQLFSREEIANLPPEQIFRNLRVSALYAFDHLLEEWIQADPAIYPLAAPPIN